MTKSLRICVFASVAIVASSMAYMTVAALKSIDDRSQHSAVIDHCVGRAEFKLQGRNGGGDAIMSAWEGGSHVVFRAPAGNAWLGSGGSEGPSLGLLVPPIKTWPNGLESEVISLQFRNGMPGLAATYHGRTVWISFEQLERLDTLSRETKEPPLATEK